MDTQKKRDVQEERRLVSQRIAACNNYAEYLKYVKEVNDSLALRAIIQHDLMNEETYNIIWEKFMRDEYVFPASIKDSCMTEFLALPMSNPVERLVKHFDVLSYGAENPYVNDSEGLPRHNYLESAATSVLLAIEKQGEVVHLTPQFEAFILSPNLEGYFVKTSILKNEGVTFAEIVSLAERGSYAAQQVATNYDFMMSEAPTTNTILEYGMSLLRESGINTAAISYEWMIHIMNWDWYEKYRMPLNGSIYS